MVGEKGGNKDVKSNSYQVPESEYIIRLEVTHFLYFFLCEHQEKKFKVQEEIFITIFYDPQIRPWLLHTFFGLM